MCPIDYGNFEVSQESKKKTRVVDSHGNNIKLSSRQKNELYRKAKDLREKVKNSLCSRNECWNPTDSNVRKMSKELGNSKVMESFKQHMKAIGADPRDVSIEKMRRRG